MSWACLNYIYLKANPVQRLDLIRHTGDRYQKTENVEAVRFRFTCSPSPGYGADRGILHGESDEGRSIYNQTGNVGGCGRCGGNTVPPPR